MMRYLLLLALMLSASPAIAAAELAGHVIASQGVVDVYSPETRKWRALYGGKEVYAGETLRTGEHAWVSLRLEDETMLKVRQNSFFTLEEVPKTARWETGQSEAGQSFFRKATVFVKSIFRLARGSIWMRNNNRQLNSRVVTTTVSIGIRGTEISVSAKDSGDAEVSVLEGAAAVENPQGEFMVESGQLARLSAQREPELVFGAQVQKSVQWTIQFPSHLAAALAREVGQDHLSDALQAAEYEEARRILTQQPSTPMARDPANLLLALIALLTGDHEEAQRLLQLDYSDNRYNSIKVLLQGYQAQLGFDLDAAQRHYQQALQLDPDNQAALYHLALVYFGMDRKQQAATTLERLRAKNSEHVGGDVLRGFLLLSERQTEQAATLWSGVLETYPAESDAWFGLSLARMRQGRSEDAFAAIASAVALNPRSSMYLSYWGKMLYQVRRFQRAQVVLESAARFDPNDPTPGFYLGLIHQELNQPDQAIERFQQAIRLNDNQGVYRSRSLLDKDLAVRNIDLAQSFVKLGLRHWASKKAVDSIQSDYSNYSAHLMQAGAYDDDPARSFLFLNEALQSLMFVPATANSFSSYNHYSSMLEQPELNLSLKVTAGSFDQAGLHGIVSGARPDRNIAYNLSVMQEQIDGWRDSNSEQHQDLTGIFKWQPNERHNSFIQLSQNHAELADDLFPRYEIDAPAYPDAFYDGDLSLISLGHRFHQNHEWDQLFYLNHSKLDYQQQSYDSQVIFDNDPNLTTESDSNYDFEQELTLLQWQAHYKSGDSQWVFGALASKGTQQSKNDFSTSVQNTGVITPLSDDQSEYSLDYSHLSVYLNHFWQPLDWLQTQIGLYQEKVDHVNPMTGGEWETDETLPRLGFAFKLSPHQTLRLASFEYLLPDTSARLDPSTVAGIPISRNMQIGSQVDEQDIQWEYEFDRGLLKLNAFNAEKDLTSSQDVSGVQVESTLHGKIKGVELTGEYLLGGSAGLSATFQHLKIDDEAAGNYRVNDIMVNTNRDEQSLRIAYNQWFNRSYRWQLESYYRDMDFKDSRADESITLLNTALYFESNDKSNQLSLKVENLTDEEFNWVTDALVINGFAPHRKVELSYQYSF